MAVDSELVESRSEEVLSAACGVFTEHGFHGASIRQIARAAGLSVPGLYHHFPAKYDLLLIIIHRVMDDLLLRTGAVLRSSDRNDPAMQLAAITAEHVVFHTERQSESFIANSELRSLKPSDLEAVIAKRDRQQRFFDSVILRGVESGHFSCAYPLETSRAVVTMCTAVASWYKKDGRLDSEEIASRYVAITLHAAGYVKSDIL